MKAIAYAWVVLLTIPLCSQTPESSNPSPPPEAPRVLSASGRINFHIPMFGSMGRMSCDAAGDMIFNIGSSVGIDDHGPFLRVQADGKSHVIYVLPAEMRKWGNIAWTVTPGGRFYVLFGDFKEYKLVRFNRDGSVASVSSLNIPAGVDVYHLAATDDEFIFVRGFLSSSGPQEKARSGYAAILDSSGKLVRDLSSEAPQEKLNKSTAGPLEGDAVAGEDGRFYVLDEKRVLAINRSGEIERELSFKKPSEGALAVQVDYSKGRVLILFHTIRRENPAQRADVKVRAIVLNAQTGDQQGDYVFDAQTTGSVLCFDGQEGFSLMAVDGDMAAKDIVPIR